MCCFRYGCADAPHSLMRPKVLRYCYNTKRNHACSAPSPQLTHTAASFSLCRVQVTFGMAPGVAQLGELLRHSCGRSCTLCVRSDDKKTSFASGDMSSQLAKDISQHRSSQLRRSDSLSNFIHAYVAGRRSSSLPAWLLPRSQAPIELSGSVTVDMSRRKETNILFII